MVGAAAARATRLDRLTLRVALCVRRPPRLPRAAERARIARRAEAFVGREPTGSPAGRLRTAPAPIADQVRFEREWGAAPHVRRRRVASGSSATSRSTSPRTVPTRQAYPELFQRGEVAGVPPTGSARSGSTGAIRSTTGRTARDRLPLVDRALPADVRAGRRRAHRPLPRLRRVLGRPRAARDREHGPLPAAPGRGALRRRRARLGAAARRRGPRRDHARRRHLRDRLGVARHGRVAVRVRRPPASPHHRLEPRRAAASSTSPPTTPTTAGWWRSPLRPGRTAGDRPPGRARTGS